MILFRNSKKIDNVGESNCLVEDKKEDRLIYAIKGYIFMDDVEIAAGANYRLV